MTYIRSLVFLFALAVVAALGIHLQDRANKHELKMKTIAPAVAVQVTPVAPPINGEALAMAQKAQKVAEEKGHSFSFEGGGAKFDLGAGCNACQAAAPAPVVAQAPPKVKTVTVYRERPVPLKRSIRYYRRFAQAETMVTAPRRAEARWGRDPLVMYAAPHAARNFTYARPPRGCPAGSAYTPVKMEGLRMLPNPGCHFSSHSDCAAYAARVGKTCDRCYDRNWVNKPWVVRVKF